MRAPEALAAWCTLAGQLLAKPLPQPGEAGEPSGMPAALDARPRWPWWRAKKWGAKVFVRLGDSYSQPKVRARPLRDCARWWRALLPPPSGRVTLPFACVLLPADCSCTQQTTRAGRSAPSSTRASPPPRPRSACASCRCVGGARHQLGGATGPTFEIPCTHPLQEWNGGSGRYLPGHVIFNVW